jgi:hypothetical protein
MAQANPILLSPISYLARVASRRVKGEGEKEKVGERMEIT